MAWQLDVHVQYRLATPYAVQGFGAFTGETDQGGELKEGLPHRDSRTYATQVDQGVERGPDGWPLIPASSWRGRVRAHLETLLRGLDVPVCRPPDPARTCPHDGPVLARLQEHGRRFCPVCEIFGSPWLPSRVSFTDLTHPHCTGDAVPVAERVNVAISRLLGSVEEQRLVVYETAGDGGGEGRKLEGRISGHLEPAQAGLLLAALRLTTHLGGKKARGLGLIEAVDVRVTRRTTRVGAEEPQAVEAGQVERWLEEALEEVTRLAAPRAL